MTKDKAVNQMGSGETSEGIMQKQEREGITAQRKSYEGRVR